MIICNYILLIIIFFSNFFIWVLGKNEGERLIMNETSLSSIFLLFFFTMIVFVCVGEEGSFCIEFVL